MNPQTPSNRRAFLFTTMLNPEHRPLPAIEKFLWDVEHRMTHTTKKDLGENPFFTHDIHERQGCRVGYMQPDLFTELCAKYKLNPDTIEVLFAQIHARTTPYVPLASGLVYMPLNERHGYRNSKGGIYKGQYHGREPAYELSYTSARSHKLMRVYPKDLVFLKPEENAVLSAIVFVSPKMKKEDGFHHMLHFPGSLVSVGERRATVIIP